MEEWLIEVHDGGHRVVYKNLLDGRTHLCGEYRDRPLDVLELLRTIFDEGKPEKGAWVRLVDHGLVSVWRFSRETARA